MPSVKDWVAAGGHWVADLAETLRAWPWYETARTLMLRFREDRLGLSAGSLTFTTLIALVPLLAVMLAVFTAFPIFRDMQSALERYLLQALVPDSIAQPVLRALTEFAQKASHVGVVGTALFVSTAIAMMLTIDRTLNAIWRVRRPRSLTQRVLVYWAGLTLGPLAIGLSLSATSYALSASRGLVSVMPGSFNALVEVLQFLLLAGTMAGLYRYVPNTDVRWRHAWSGGLFVAVGFELAKKLLTWYVESVGTFSTVYGAFAFLPVLLLWIYLGWSIVLLGAVIAAYAPSLKMRVTRLGDEPGGRFTLALDLLGRLHAARADKARGLSLLKLAGALRQDPLQIEPVLDRLMDIGWVGRLEEAGEQRFVLLGEPAGMPLQPMVEALLLAPRPQTRFVAGCLGERTLADVLRA